MCVQDTKKVLAELRDANFAAEEQQESLTALEASIEAATQQLSTAQQSNAELEKEVLLQSQQQQHLLDELSQLRSATLSYARGMHPHTCLLDTCKLCISTFKHKAHSMTIGAALSCTWLTCQAAFTSQVARQYCHEPAVS